MEDGYYWVKRKIKKPRWEVVHIQDKVIWRAGDDYPYDKVFFTFGPRIAEPEDTSNKLDTTNR